MFTLYPSNKLDHLSALLAGLLDAQPSPPLKNDIILVDNPGMQHWLHLQLAQSRNISMNLTFPLAIRFVWDIARVVLGEKAIPEASPYRREVLRFRIHGLLGSQDFTKLDVAKSAMQYIDSATTAEESGLRRMSLAIQIADAFEQYIIFRPEWLADWETGRDAIASPNSSWQRVLWKMLVEQEPWHPANLLEKTIHRLNQQGAVSGLPSRIILFGLNAMAPSILSLFEALAKHCDIHFFYLNPSASYWGDVQTDKARAKQQWQNTAPQLTLALTEVDTDDVSNSIFDDSVEQSRLLANLGQHGRELLNRLTQLDKLEISAFEQNENGGSSHQATLLQRLQQSVFELQYTQANARLSWQTDRSITWMSCHTALREVQALHDYLLNVISDNSDIKEQDIVVMCPAIEDYAPYVYSVFGKPSSTQPGVLRCSISDRADMLAHPIIATFLQLLDLPDSRFQVSAIMQWLELDAIRNKFGFDEQDIPIINRWLDDTHIHWGLNGDHKRAIVSEDYSSEQNSWQWGLKRLLYGLVTTDDATVLGDVYSVPLVEGQHSVLLGKLVAFVEQLNEQRQHLKRVRSMSDWAIELTGIQSLLFERSPENQIALETVSKAISELTIHVDQAGSDEHHQLSEIRELLRLRFSNPDVRNHFLTGQITFCSLMPMRSIPFRVVALLGLNDNSFPRKASPSSINLLEQDTFRPGDRSREREDKYLFLEALLSARDKLYLSYQGRNSRDNTPRQPSSVLSLFAEELQVFCADPVTPQHVALHHFSEQNYRSIKTAEPDSKKIPSFNRGGLRLAESLRSNEQENPAFSPVMPLPESIAQGTSVQTITPQIVAQALDHPLAYFAKQKLGVVLDIPVSQLEDDEPFISDGLTRFQALSEIQDTGFEYTAQSLRMSGVLPDSAIGEHTLTVWRDMSGLLYEQLPDDYAQQPFSVSMSYSMSDADEQSLVWADTQCLKDNTNYQHHWGAQSAKRKVQQWLNHLICQASKAEPVITRVSYIAWNKQELRSATYSSVSQQDAMRYLNDWYRAYLDILTSPVLLFAGLGEALGKAKDAPLDAFCKAWQGNDFTGSLDNDPYLKWLIGEDIQWNSDAVTQSIETLSALFVPMMASLKDTKVGNL